MFATIARFRLLLTCSIALGIIQSAYAAEEAETDIVLEEVLVTAQRRGPERLQDVPMSVSVIDSELIQKIGLVEMKDYLRALPSTSFIDRGAGQNNVIIRGIAANFEWEDTVGIYIGDVPVTSLGVHGAGSPDLKLVDIARIEVLRGPQGTLYGAGSMGGTVRIVPAPPDTGQFDAAVQASYSVTAAEGGDNNTLEGMLNLPFLGGDAALRLVAYRHDNSGYYRNVAGSDPETRYWSDYFGVPAQDQNDIGSTTYKGWRAQLLWQPTPALKIALMAIGQDIDQTGLPEGELGLADFHQTRLNKIDGGGETLVMDFDLTSLEVSYDLEPFSLLSTTSLVESQAGSDTTYNSDFIAPIFGVGAIPIFNEWAGPAKSFTQEVRLTSRQDRRFRYLVGLFLQDVESSVSNKFVYEGDPAMDPLMGVPFWSAVGDFDEEQQALFGEVSFDLNDHLSASAGIRFYRYEQSTRWTGSGWAAPAHDDLTTSKDDDNNLSLKLEYAFGESTQLYGSFSQGFRLGGPHPIIPPEKCDVDGDNVIDGTDIPVPSMIASDYADSYEMGAKYLSRDGHFSLNTAVFFVDWAGIPVGVPVPCGWPVTLNAGKAKSYGAEIEGLWEPIEGLLIDFAASWIRPELAEDTPSLGEAGDRLPGSPEYNLHLGIEYDFNIGKRNAFLRADLVSVGEYYADLQKTGMPLGGYTTVGLRGGMTFEHVLLELYAHNLTNEFAVTYRDPWGSANYIALRPRTIGVQVSYRFSDR